MTYNYGSWSAITGTGASTPSCYSANQCTQAISPDLTLTSNSSGENYTLGGTYNYTITWTPAVGDPVPTSITVLLDKQCQLSAFGTGTSELLQGMTVLQEMDSTNDALAGFTTYISQQSYTLPLVLQSNGTYLATGSVTTDTLSVTYNSSTGGATSCEESFTVDTMTANS